MIIHTNDENIEEIHINNYYGYYCESIEEFETSLFKDVYYNSLQMTAQIVIRQKGEQEDKQYNIPSDKKTYNIIPFIGGRGTGKTSAMHSVSNFLKTFDENNCKEFFEKYELSKKLYEKSKFELTQDCGFTCLDIIDASLLDEGEDIFEAVLAKMLQLLLNHRSSSRCRNWEDDRENQHFFKREQVITKFQDIYNYLHSNRDKDLRYESPVELLKNLAKSLDICDSFKDLVPTYLNEINSKYREHYLVICIDDLDLNCKGGFRMLEQIHRYLMVPNVIIYMTFSMSGLLAITERHFAPCGVNNKKKLASNYLDKVLPISQRVYLPILFEKGDSTIIIDGDNRLPVKKSFLFLIANKTGIFFDPQGVKKHFYEPANIRELVHLCVYFNKMQNILLPTDFTKDSTQFLANLDQNISSLLEDIYYRMSEYLNLEQKELFEELYLMDTARQVIRFCTYKETLDGLSEKKKRDYIDDVDNKKYSYGEFIQGIYRLGREHVDQKPLIHCILALQSIQLTNLYYHSIYDNMQKKLKTRMLNCFQRSVTGSWGDHLVPLLALQVTEGVIWNYYWGYIKNIPLKVDNLLKGLIACPSPTEDKLEFCLTLLNDSKRSFVKSIELFYFYFINFSEYFGNIEIDKSSLAPKSKEQFVKEINENDSFLKENSKNENKYLNIYFNGASSFDITGFVLNSMNYEKFFHNVHKIIFNAIVNYIGEISPDDIDRIKDRIKAMSLNKEYCEWDTKYGYAPLPVYSTDIFYNLIKRIKREQESSSIIKIDGVLDENIKLLILINNKLKMTDLYYNDETNIKNKCKFSDVFSNCPYVKLMLNNPPELFKELFKNYILLASKIRQAMRIESAQIDSSMEE